MGYGKLVILLIMVTLVTLLAFLFFQKRQVQVDLLMEGKVEMPVDRSGETFSEYYNEQLSTTYGFDGYEYVLVQRSSMNLPIFKSTNFAGVLRRAQGEPTYEKYLEITSNPDSAKNNLYMLWFDNGLFLMMVDQVGAGSGEGTAKVIKIVGKNTELVKCFYYVPEEFDDLEKVKSKLSDKQDSDCFNYTIKVW